MGMTKVFKNMCSSQRGYMTVEASFLMPLVLLIVASMIVALIYVYEKEHVRANIAEALHLELDQVNIKATTEEGLGFTGTGEGISSQAVCLIDKPEFYMDGTIGCGGCGGCKN